MKLILIWVYSVLFITKKSEYASTIPDNIVQNRGSRRYSVHSRVRMAIGQTAFSEYCLENIYIDSAIEIIFQKRIVQGKTKS